MNSKMKIGIVTAILVIAGFIVFRMVSKGKTEERVVDNRTTVLVRKAELGSLQRYLDLYGELKAENEVSITSPVTGKVLRFNRFEGDSVRRNQSVVSIDRFEVGARYAAAPVTSPVNGVVTRILVSEGADVTIGTAVAMVGDINKLEALIQVPENYAPEIKVGQPVYFRTRAVPDRVFEGEITRRDLSLNPDTRSLTVRATIDNKDHALFSGIFAESFVFIEEVTNIFVVPESALAKTKEGQDAIFVNENETAVLRPIEIALRYRDQVAIGSGISVGEEMIVFGREYLSEGAPIRPLPEVEVSEQPVEELTDQENQ
ncbi:MAG: efflux RND transporter periplasmic adaptor subunit [Brevinema sp.]